MYFVSSAHLVETSCWPLISSFGVSSLFLGLVLYLKNFSFVFSFLGVLLIAVVMGFWFKDVLKENLLGFHKSYVLNVLRTGMVFFILSEIFFFFGFFWGYFHSIFNIDMVDVQYVWFWNDKVEWDVPLLKTVLLVSSGVFLTWAHQELILVCLPCEFEGLGVKEEGTFLWSFFPSGPGMFFLAFDLTLILGIFFLFLQWMEFELKEFSIKSSVFGSCFYMLTGFHGLHVFVGVVFLSVFLIRVSQKTFGGFKSNHFLMASWYWHFVDVVWLFLFIFIYPSDWSDFFCFLY